MLIDIVSVTVYTHADTVSIPNICVFLHRQSIDTAMDVWYTIGADTMSANDAERRTTMIKGTPELIATRREEILNACQRLYQTMSFKQITLKEIGEATSFSRPTIYNYFQTKEEIFLALYEREYDLWNAELESLLSSYAHLTREELARHLAGSLEKREQLLKRLAMNNYDMEANSRPELLVSFKRAYGRSMENVDRILQKFCPDLSAAQRTGFRLVFFPFMFGIYPYAAVTDKQRSAMKEAGVDFRYLSIYELTLACLRRLLGPDA